MNADNDAKGATESATVPMARTHIDKWCDNLARLLRFSLIATASILIVAYNAGLTYGRIEKRATALKMGNTLFLDEDAEFRSFYAQYCRDALGEKDFHSPFRRYVRDRLQSNNESKRLIQQLFADVDGLALN